MESPPCACLGVAGSAFTLRIGRLSWASLRLEFQRLWFGNCEAKAKKMAGRRRRKKYSRMIQIGAFIVAAFLGVLMGVMVGLLLHGKTLKRSEGATRQKGFSIGLSLDSRA
jgi:hypothetical protein